MASGRPLGLLSAGIDPLSHLSILPTILRDADCLEATLESLELHPGKGGHLKDFSGVPIPVELQVSLSGGQVIGWKRQADGTLALVGDLQRISRSESLQALLGSITRAYAARVALAEAGAIPGGVIHLSA